MIFCTAAELEKVADLYAQLYEGSELSAEEIWEEIICDSLGDMNVFSDTMTAQDAPVALLLETAKQETLAAQKEARGPPEGQKNTAPGEGRMSISFLSENDIGDYLRAESRRNISKSEAMNRDQQVILTTSQEIHQYVRDAIAGKKLATVGYAKVADRLAQDADTYSKGKNNVSDYYLELVADDIKHAWNEHHLAKQAGDIDLTLDDFVKIADYIANYDELIYAIEFGTGQKRIATGITLPGGKAVVVQVASKSRGALQFKNMIGMTEEKYQQDFAGPYQQKNRSIASTRGSRSSNISLPNANASTNSLPNSSQKSNTQNAEGHTSMAVRFVVEERENLDPVLVESRVLSRLYAANAKKVSVANAQTAYRVLTPAFAHFSYNVADLLNDVKNIFDDTFSKV